MFLAKNRRYEFVAHEETIQNCEYFGLSSSTEIFDVRYFPFLNEALEGKA